jgi:hypothetical protein
VKSGKLLATSPTNILPQFFPEDGSCMSLRNKEQISTRLFSFKSQDYTVTIHTPDNLVSHTVNIFLILSFVEQTWLEK